MATLQFAFDHTGWNEQEERTCHNTLMRYVRKLDASSLDYVQKDCLQAVDAMPEGKKAGHYTDTALYIGMRKSGNLNRARSQKK